LGEENGAVSVGRMPVGRCHLGFQRALERGGAMLNVASDLFQPIVGGFEGWRVGLRRRERRLGLAEGGGGSQEERGEDGGVFHGSSFG
jgi:hypothetical protein